MATLAVATIRARIATALEAVNTWTESRWAPGLFGRDTDHLQHHVFAVDMLTTNVHPTTQRRQLAEGALVDTEIVIRWAERLTQDNQVSAYNTALGSEATVITTVEGVSGTDLHLLYEGSDRNTDTEGWFLGATRFRAIHRLALS